MQGEKKLTAKVIAPRFLLSLRTVYRDIKAPEESGVLVIGEAGTGHSVIDGYRRLPVMFTQKEAMYSCLPASLPSLTDASSPGKNHDKICMTLLPVLTTWRDGF